jgi:hypothetical protein
MSGVVHQPWTQSRPGSALDLHRSSWVAKRDSASVTWPAGWTYSLDGERIIVDTKPVLFAFFSFYLPGIYLIAAAVLLYLFGRDHVLPLFPTQWSPRTTELLYAIFQALSIVLPALAFSFAKLNFRWLFSSLILVGAAAGVTYGVLDMPLVPPQDLDVWRLHSGLLVVFSAGVLSVVQNEVYRQSHHYVVTNLRITTSAGIVRRKQRSLLLSKINDLSVDESFFGAVLGYGTMVPLTASGLGMGTTFAGLTGAASKRLFGMPTLGVAVTGGHSIQIPKYRTHEVLFGVPHAQRTATELMDIIVQREIETGARR